MSRQALQLLACLSMTLDHIGVHLVPYDTPIYWVLRGAGRLAMPIFCFLLAEGAKHTRHPRRYLGRLLGMAVAIELPLLLCDWQLGTDYRFSINIFWTLSASLAILLALQQPRLFGKIAGLAGLCLLPFTRFDYGIYAAFLVLLFAFIPSFWGRATRFVALQAITIGGLLPFVLPKMPPIQWLALLSLLPIAAYNGRSTPKHRYFFYFYYPAHLAVILAVQQLLYG